jgi:hypothetical protein
VSFPDDVNDFRLPDSMTAPPRPSRRPPRHRAGERFLKGPVPWAWLDRAGRLPGKTLAVGLVIWHRAGMSPTGKVRLCQTRVSDLGLTETSIRRAIANLEADGLIEVWRKPGQGLELFLKKVRDPRDHVTRANEDDPVPLE